jgi:hypothetical protein
MPRNERAPRTKAPFSKRQLRAALDEAKAAGVARLTITTPAGASFDFDLSGEQSAAAENDFDAFPCGKSQTLSIPRKPS